MVCDDDTAERPLRRIRRRLVARPATLPTTDVQDDILWLAIRTQWGPIRVHTHYTRRCGGGVALDVVRYILQEACLPSANPRSADA